MNDNEIIKALEGMTYGGHSCMHCKYGTTKGDYMCGLQGCKIGRDALDLINRQQAEIERLRNALMGECMLTKCSRENEIKTEAIKEFAEKLKERFSNEDYMLCDYEKDTIDNLVKEMVGDDV